MDLKSIVSTVAPWIGTALGGPLGSLAINAACDALGISEGNKEKLQSVLSEATTEQMLLLKKADQEFSLQMQALGFNNIKDIESILAEDRKDARAMQVSTKSYMPAFLASILTAGMLVLLFVLVYMWFQKENSILLNMIFFLLGNIVTVWLNSTGFFTGTTKGSAEKTRFIERQLES